MSVPEPTTPMDVFELIRERAWTMTQTAFIESGRALPEDAPTRAFLKTMLGIGIAAASEHYAANPEHLALAGAPICTVCREPIQSLQVGIDPARDPEQQLDPIKVAWPCGHLQS